MAEIFQLVSTKPNLKLTPEGSVIHFLKDVLGDAEKGEVVAVMMATIYRNGNVGTGFRAAGDRTTGELLLATRDLYKRVEEWHDGVG